MANLLRSIDVSEQKVSQILTLSSCWPGRTEVDFLATVACRSDKLCKCVSSFALTL